MRQIRAQDLQRRTGEVQDMALRAPVAITHHGREKLVLMSRETYDRLSAGRPPTTDQNRPDIGTIRAVRLFQSRAADLIGAPPTYLFGSRARGMARTDSDIDLALILPDKLLEQIGAIRLKLRLADIAYDVLLECGLRISPLPIAETRWQQADGTDALIQTIRRDGLAI